MRKAHATVEEDALKILLMGQVWMGQVWMGQVWKREAARSPLSEYLEAGFFLSVSQT
jgi:spermidine/putrescine-binding protein